VISPPLRKRCERSRTVLCPKQLAVLIARYITPEWGSNGGQYFGRWKKGPDPFAQNPLRTSPIQTTEVIVVEQPVNTIDILRMWQGPSVSKDTKATLRGGRALVHPLVSRPPCSTRISWDTDLQWESIWLPHAQPHSPVTLSVQTTAEKSRTAGGRLIASWQAWPPPTTSPTTNWKSQDHPCDQ